MSTKSLSTINRIMCLAFTVTSRLGPLPPYPTSQLDIFGHDGDTLGMDGTQVGVLKETHQVCLASLLEGSNGSTLETEVSLEVLRNLPHQALEGQFTNQQLSGLLVPTDLPQSHSARPVTMGLLDTAGGGGTLTGSLSRQLLTWSFASS